MASNAFSRRIRRFFLEGDPGTLTADGTEDAFYGAILASARDHCTFLDAGVTIMITRNLEDVVVPRITDHGYDPVRLKAASFLEGRLPVSVHAQVVQDKDVDLVSCLAVKAGREIGAALEEAVVQEVTAKAPHVTGKDSGALFKSLPQCYSRRLSLVGGQGVRIASFLGPAHETWAQDWLRTPGLAPHCMMLGDVSQVFIRLVPRIVLGRGTSPGEGLLAFSVSMLGDVVLVDSDAVRVLDYPL